MARLANFTPNADHPQQRCARWRCLAVVAACSASGQLLGGCSVPLVTTARMALADSLVSEAPARFEHALQGSPLPLAQPAGYRITYAGRASTAHG